MAATLIFLQIKDRKGKFIAGESTASNYVGQIEIESFSWGAKADHSAQAGTQVSKQVQYDKLELTKFYDRSTTALCQMMAASGTVGGRAEPVPFDFALMSFVDIVFGSAKSAGVPVLEIRLDDGFIEEIKLAANESGKTMQVKETLVLSFRTVKFVYYVGGEDRAVRGRGFQFEAEASSVKD